MYDPLPSSLEDEGVLLPMNVESQHRFRCMLKLFVVAGWFLRIVATGRRVNKRPFWGYFIGLRDCSDVPSQTGKLLKFFVSRLSCRNFPVVADTPPHASGSLRSLRSYVLCTVASPCFRRTWICTPNFIIASGPILARAENPVSLRPKCASELTPGTGQNRPGRRQHSCWSC